MSEEQDLIERLFAAAIVTLWRQPIDQPIPEVDFSITKPGADIPGSAPNIQIHIRGQLAQAVIQRCAEELAGDSVYLQLCMKAFESLQDALGVAVVNGFDLPPELLSLTVGPDPIEVTH